MDIQKSIVAILDKKKKIIGTGFVAGENLILTCAHVVETVISNVLDPTTDLNVQVTVRFATDGSEVVAQVDAQSCSPSYERDAALLRVDILPQGVEPLPLAPAAGSAGHDFYAYGYATVTNVQGIGARGKIVDIVDNGRLVQLTSQEPDHGMSGGPVLDEQRRAVIGMVTKGKGVVGKDNSLRNIYTTFATSTQVIFEVCHELKPTEICPYRSLDAFTEDDAPFFFGRERVVTKLLESLKREPRFLAVLGPSGSGKSSVVRAGLIPALRQGKVPGSQKWGIITIRPANQPFEQLAGAGFINPQAGLENAVKTWLADRPDITRLMLVIDQFEEVLISTPTDIRQKFIAELAQLLDVSLTITVVLTLRDDFYSRFLHEAAVLTSWLERALVNIPPTLERDNLLAMIVEPAKSVGLVFDIGLADTIIEDACESDHSKGLARSTILPLLQFALTQLWKRQKNGRFTHADYFAIGGVTGGLAQWADWAYYELESAERTVARLILTDLVYPGDILHGIPAMRSAKFEDEIAYDDISSYVIQKLVNARLIVKRWDENNKKHVTEIIHDALLVEWALIQDWLIEDRSFLAWKNGFEMALRRWDESENNDGALLQGLLLTDAEKWVAERPNQISESGKQYIVLSIALRERINSEKEHMEKSLLDVKKNFALAFDSTIEFLSRMLELRNVVGEGHGKRVTEITVEFAQVLGIPDDQIVNIRNGALLHDIGKLFIPETILHKTTPLTDEEWNIMRKHPEYANEMLSPITHLKPALDIPYCHHEKWDGSGYPRGLKGDQIPLSARIFALVDVYDALMANRSYRRSFGQAKTLEYIDTHRGSSFDPGLVDKFLEFMKQKNHT